MKHFPLVPWLVFAGIAVDSSVTTWLLWTERGPARWYIEPNNRGSIGRLFFKGTLPIAISFSCLTLLILVRYVEKSTTRDIVKAISSVLEWLLGISAGIASIGSFSTFYFDYPNLLIAPIFRRQREQELGKP